MQYLPDPVLHNIFTHISFDEISKARLVCKRFDEVARYLLNQGFYRAERFAAHRLHFVKEILPRRDSERRKHLLWGHCDTLTAIESQLSILGMTFLKRMELENSFFIPGKVLDEIFRLVRFITSTPAPLQNNGLLQELRDISSMAIEHFEEKIAAKYRKRSSVQHDYSSKFDLSADLIANPMTSGDSQFSAIKVPSAKHELIKVQLGYCQLKSKYSELKNESLETKKKVAEFRKKLKQVKRKATEQSAVISEHETRINSQGEKLAELYRKMTDFEKIVENTTVHLKTEETDSKTSDVQKVTLQSEKVESTSTIAKRSPTKRVTDSCESPSKKRMKK